MRDACIRAVERALGRPLSKAEAVNIEARVRGAHLQEARRDPVKWNSLSSVDRLIIAGQRAARDLVDEVRKKTQRVQLQVVAHERVGRYRADQINSGRDKNGVDALIRTLVAKYDLKNGDFVSVETQANATMDDAMRQLSEVFETVSPGLWRRIQEGMLTSEPLRRSFVDALHGLTKGAKPEVARAAQLYHDIAEQLRTQFNAAGGVVGRLESWGAPHTWSPRFLQRAGKTGFIDDMLGWVDPNRYVHEDGRFYSDAELRNFLGEAWDTIVSDGLTEDVDILPFPGGSIKANRNSQHRVLHLRPDAAYDALRKYSELNVLEAMIQRLRGMSRDVALVETFGPNADHEFELQLSTAEREAAKLDPSQSARLRGKAAYLRRLYGNIAGNTHAPESRALMEAGGTLRALQVAAKLGSATITSITDLGPLYQTALLNRLNPFKVALNSSLVWSGKSRRYARRMGLMLDTMRGAAERYTNENLTGAGLARRTASAVIRASFLGFVTNARRVGFAVTMMDAIGHLTRQSAYRDVRSLQGGDYRILASKGITQEHWDIWRSAQLDNWGANHTLLTPDAIMAVQGYSFEARRSAARMLLGLVREEQDLAIITPGVRERTQLEFGTQAGTLGGELVRSATLFKSFPWTIIQRHGERAGAVNFVGGRFGYMGSLVVTMTTLGVANLIIRDLLAGKDPRTFDVLTDDDELRAIALKNWTQALMAGGALGVYGDFLFAETSPYSGRNIYETMAGPNLSSTISLADLTVGNLKQLAFGEETHFGREAVQFARGHTPFANLWYTRALTDRAIFNQLSELAEPGYMARLERSQRRNQGTEYWWPMDANPWEGEFAERAPGEQ